MARDRQPNAVIVVLATNESNPHHWYYAKGFALSYHGKIRQFQKNIGLPGILIANNFPAFLESGVYVTL